ncbi:MAG: hypothetical protein WA823_09375 [Candidatus Acidiferrales bacterium]
MDDIIEALNRIFGQDSLDTVELVMAIEENHSEAPITVGDLFDFLERGESDEHSTPIAKR